MAPQPRSTQSERRAATRAAILDAAAARLVEEGLGGVTIAAVAERAGVSSGAVLHHYPTKNDLIIALASHLSDASKDSAVVAADPHAPLAERIDAMADAIVEVVFAPASRAQFELHTASRTSPEFAEHLRVLNARNAEAYISDLAGALLEADVPVERIRAALEFAICAAIGLSLLTLSGGDEPAEERLAASIKELLLREVEAAAEG